MNDKELFKDLESKIAIVTGAAQGIGKAIAQALVHFGVNVLAVDIMDSDISQQNEGSGGRLVGIKADVSDPDAVRMMVESCREKIGIPDILVNVAAISRPAYFKDTTLEAWNKMIKINLTSVYLCSHAVLPYMLEKKKGVIINFSSLVAHSGAEVLSSYCAAKGGIEAFSRCLAQEVGPQGIRINNLAPGMIDTQMLALLPEGEKQRLAKRIPVRRLGLPEDFAGIILLLASDAGSYINGQTIHVNGGALMF